MDRTHKIDRIVKRGTKALRHEGPEGPVGAGKLLGAEKINFFGANERNRAQTVHR